MKTRLQYQNYKIRMDKLFTRLQNDILDEYNRGNISLNEMENIILWCEKMKNRMIIEYEKNGSYLF